MRIATLEEVERLNQLCVPWGGKIVRSTAQQMKKAEDRRSYFSAPFLNMAPNLTDRLGILWAKKQILYLADHPPSVSDIIHEMGHVFATRKNPERSEEYDFFGWEYRVAQVIGYPHDAWVQDNADYTVDNQDQRPFGSLSPQAVNRLLDERVKVAKILGLIRNDLPIAIR